MSEANIDHLIYALGVVLVFWALAWGSRG